MNVPVEQTDGGICRFCKAQNPAGAGVCNSCGMPAADDFGNDWFERAGRKSFRGLKLGAEGLATAVLLGVILVAVPVLWTVKHYRQAGQLGSQESSGNIPDTAPDNSPSSQNGATQPGQVNMQSSSLPPKPTAPAQTTPSPSHEGTSPLAVEHARLERSIGASPKPAALSSSTAHPGVQPYNPPPAIQNFQADVANIERGSSTILRWSIADGSNVKIEPALGTFSGEAGQVSVSPEQTTQYTLLAAGPGGTASAQYTVHVVLPPKPALIFDAEPGSIIQGQGTRLSWGASGASKVSIQPEIGAVNASGSITMRPSHTTTYTLTAEGPGGVSRQDVTISVSAPTQPTGQLVWSGIVNGVQLVTIERDHADVGNLEGSLPGTACIIQPLDERHVSVASSPGPRNNYERLVVRVSGKGLVRAVIKWSLQ